MNKIQAPNAIKMCDNRMSLNQTLIEIFNAKSYLEIGCCKDTTFQPVRCALKVGVDPVEGGTHRMTSDEFFAQNTDKFDHVFIDGYHHHDQVYRDVINTLGALTPEGTIVMHDCNPTTRDRESQLKCGTAWRALVKLRERSDLDVIVCNYDHGLGIIKIASNPSQLTIKESMDELTYDDLEAHRDDWLRLSSQQQVAQWITKFL